MATAGGNQDLLFVLGMKALRETDGVPVYWALQRHHPDGKRWIEVGRFPTRKVAKMGLEAFVTSGHGDPEDFRLRKVHLPPT